MEKTLSIIYKKYLMSVPHHHSGTANDMSEYLAGTANTSHMFGDNDSRKPSHSSYNTRDPYGSWGSPSSSRSYHRPSNLSDYESRRYEMDDHSMARSNSMFSGGASTASGMYPSYYNAHCGDMMSSTGSAMSTADLFGGGSNPYYAPTSSNFHESRHASITAARMEEADRLMACAKVKSSFPQPVFGAAKTASAYGEYWE